MEVLAFKVSTHEYSPEIQDDREDVQIHCIIHSVCLSVTWEASVFTHLVLVECSYRTRLPDHNDLI